MPSSRLARKLGTASPPFEIRNLVAFLLTSGLGISFLVFLNAGQAFVLNDVLRVPKEQASSIAGTLVFADELLALPLVLVWGRLADKYSPRGVVVLANLIVGVALFLFIEAKNVFPQLLLARLLFAAGASGITAMLSALLSILSSAPAPTPSSIPDEDQPLIGWRRPPPSDRTSRTTSRKSTRLAALLGVSTGLGALLAVFGFLRLPNSLGLRTTFRLVGGLAFLNALIALLGLPAPRRKRSQKTDSQSFVAGLKREIGKLTRGFQLMRGNKNVVLGYAAGFTARAQTISTAAFVPVLVAYFYRDHGLCDPLPGQDIKTGCHPAYSYASTLTGVVQLIALLTAPFLSLVRRPSHTLIFTFLLGGVSFFLLGRSTFPLLGGEDPRNALTWLGAIGIGVSQISAVVLSLGVVADAREELISSALTERAERKANAVGEGQDGETASLLSEPATTSSSSSRSSTSDLAVHAPPRALPSEIEEIAGALSGAYSAFGGLGILAVSGVGGALSRRFGPAVSFVLVAGLDLAGAGVAWWASRTDGEER